MGVIIRRRHSRGLRPTTLLAITVLGVTGYWTQSVWRSKSIEYAHAYYQGAAKFIGSRLYNNTLYTRGYDEEVVEQFDFNEACRNFPDTSGIMLVMKTGATEAFEKLPAHLLTSLQCLPDFLLFSDKEQQIGQWYVYDALDEVADSIKSRDPVFDLYKAQNECVVSQRACNDANEKRDTAWNLDKYKFIHMLEKTWRMRPNMDWYVFAEADSYVFWGNMVAWLRTQVDKKEKLYLGSLNLLNDVPFAHGGSGYILSGVVLKEMVENNPGLAAEYDERALNECCGDLLMSIAVAEKTGTKIKQAYPMINGETQSTLPFQADHWCEPLFTLHHMNSEQVSAAWQFEQTRKSKDLIQIKDIYHAFMSPKLTDYRADWDNMAEDVCFLNPDPKAQETAQRTYKDRQKKADELTDVERDAWRSRDHCAAVCAADPAGIDEEEEEEEGDHGDDEEAGEEADRWYDHDEDGTAEGEGGRRTEKADGDGSSQPDGTKRPTGWWLSATQRRLKLLAGQKNGGEMVKRDGGVHSRHHHHHHKIRRGDGDGARGNDTASGERESREKQPRKNKAKSGHLASAEVVERRKSRKCFQWRYRDGVCCTSRSFRLGAPRHATWEEREAAKARPGDKGGDRGEDDVRWHSGWHVDGIRDWVDAMGECEVKWKTID